jgi:hypothetical protein
VTTIAIATFSCLRGNCLDRVSHLSGWQLIRLLQVFEFMRHSGFLPLCLGKSFVVVSVGLLPLSLFALLSS